MHEPTLDERIEALRKRIEGIAGYDSDPLGQEAIEALAIIAWLKAELETARGIIHQHENPPANATSYSDFRYRHGGHDD